jgi:peptide/nickel transport system permease protein
MAGLAVLVVLIAFSFSAPLAEYVLGIDSLRADLFNRYGAPDGKNLLGTDEAGRDVLIRLMYGGQVSLSVGLTAAVSAAIIGTTIGVIAGYYGGTVDKVLMRITDGVIALPLLPLLIVFAAIDLRKLGFGGDFAVQPDAAFWRIVIIIAIVQWTTIARLVRASTLAVLQREYVMAAQVQGASARHIMMVHILPNAISPIIVACTLAIGQIILFESVLSFLGLGIQPPTASWGNMLTNAQEMIHQAPALAFYPGALIFITVIAVNFFGDGLQEAFDPRSEPR